MANLPEKTTLCLCRDPFGSETCLCCLKYFLRRIHLPNGHTAHKQRLYLRNGNLVCKNIVSGSQKYVDFSFYDDPYIYLRMTFTSSGAYERQQKGCIRRKLRSLTYNGIHLTGHGVDICDLPN